MPEFPHPSSSGPKTGSASARSPRRLPARSPASVRVVTVVSGVVLFVVALSGVGPAVGGVFRSGESTSVPESPLDPASDDMRRITPRNTPETIPGSGPGTGSESAPPSGGATTGPDEPRRAVLATVDEFWSAFLRANDPPDPDHPALAAVTTGAQTQLLRERITNRRLTGEHIRRSPEDRFTASTTILSIDPDRARIRSCVLDDTIIVNTALDRVVNDETVTSVFEMELRLIADRWRVAENRMISSRSGVHPC